MSTRYKKHNNQILPLFLFFLIINLGSCSVSYLNHVVQGQWQIISKQKKIEEVLEDSNSSLFIKKRLQYVNEIRTFASENLRLKVGDTFTTFLELNRDALAWNVIASKKTEFKPKLWTFPIVGKVPYLGFFEKSLAKELIQKLEKENWDVIMSEVAAYSTLGWFNDPLFSTQLAYSDVFLAELIIHESTHSTLWIPNKAKFNESFASFVEHKGALEFFIHKYGKKSKEFQEIIKSREKERKLRLLYQKYATLLDNVYKSKLSEKDKLKKKSSLLFYFEKEIKEKHSINFFKWKQRHANNADFIQYRYYHSKQEIFNKIFLNCKKDWACFFDSIKKKYTPKKKISMEDRENSLTLYYNSILCLCLHSPIGALFLLTYFLVFF